MSGAVVYIALLFLLMAATIVAEVTNKKWLKITLYVLQLLAVFLVCILKSDTVGTDTPAYKSAFDTTKATGKIFGKKDVGFYGFMFVGAKLLPNFFTFQIVFYFLTIAAYGFTFYWLTKKPHLALVVMCGTPLFTMLLSGMRQTMAICICCLAMIVFLRAKKWKKLFALPIYIVAIFFHESAMAFALFFLCYFIRFTKGNGLIFLCVYAVFLLFGDRLLSALYHIYDLQYYITSISLGLPINSLVFFFTLIACWLVLRRYGFLTKASPVLWGVYCYCLLMSSSSFSHIFSRFAFFFAPTIPLLICQVVSLLLNRQPVRILEKKYAQVGLICLPMAAFAALSLYDLCLSNSLGTYPYAFRFIK